MINASIAYGQLIDPVLTAANLSDANLTDANLSGANLCGAKNVIYFEFGLQSVPVPLSEHTEESDCNLPNAVRWTRFFGQLAKKSGKGGYHYRSWVEAVTPLSRAVPGTPARLGAVIRSNCMLLRYPLFLARIPPVGPSYVR